MCVSFLSPFQICTCAYNPGHPTPISIYTRGTLAFTPMETVSATLEFEKLLELKILFFQLIFSQLGQWRVKSCEEKLKYVCKKKGEILNETKSDESCSLEEVIASISFVVIWFRNLLKITYFFYFHVFLVHSVKSVKHFI